jgi:hypothetical protein
VHAVLALIAKLFVWHWLQPLLYFFVLYCAIQDDQIGDGLQYHLRHMP